MIIKNVSTDVFEEMYDLAFEEERDFRPDRVCKIVQLQGRNVRLSDSTYMFTSNAIIREHDVKYRIEFVKYHKRLYVNISYQNFNTKEAKEVRLDKTPEYVQDIVNICAKRIENGKGLNV